MSGARLLFPDLAPEERDAGWLADVPQVASADILQAVSARHPMDGINGRPGRWVFVREVSETTGQYGDVQRFDAVAIGLVPSVKYARVVYEVKVSRADWLRELRPRPDVRWSYGNREVRMTGRQADRLAASLATEEGAKLLWDYRLVGEYRKWDAALAMSTEFWIAAPPRCVLPDELPPEAGLLEIRPWGKERELRARVVRKAPVRETPMPGPGFWSAILRRAAERTP